MNKIAITGPECSGKSTLAQHLAAHFGVSYVPEYARTYLKGTSGQYVFEDLEHIFQGQMALEAKAMAAAGELLVICDTDVLVIKIWSQYRFGKVAPDVEEAFFSNRYTHYLLCKPDVPWQPDPFRESPQLQERNLLFGYYRKALTSIHAPYTIIEGTLSQRLQRAIEAINAAISK